MPIDTDHLRDAVETLELCANDYKNFQKLLKRLGSRTKKFYGNLYRRADGTLFAYFEKSKVKCKKNAAGDCLRVGFPIWLDVPKPEGGDEDE